METFGSASVPENKTPQRDRDLNPEEGLEVAKQLKELLDKYKDKRVLVVAPPGAGKSTLLQHIPEGIDTDNALFDDMPKNVKDFALQRENPYMLINGDHRTIKYTQKEFIPGNEKSEEDLALSSDFLTTYINAHTKIEVGKPFFATNVIDTDVIIYLKLTEELYKERLESRNKNTNRPQQVEKAIAIKKSIETDIEEAKRIGVIVEQLEVNS